MNPNGIWRGRSVAELGIVRKLTEFVLFMVTRKAREPSGQKVQFACDTLKGKRNATIVWWY